MAHNRDINFIDLFCGIGGFHQALTKLGCNCILACDIDKACRENYKLNYNIDPHPDVRKINPNDINEKVDIICGGFPCQTFSNAGKKKMFDDDRGLLFDEIIRIANVTKPKFMFLENVKHILKVGDGKVIEYIKKKLDENNYHLQLFEISPHHYGVPQQRDRVYFVRILHHARPPCDVPRGERANAAADRSRAIAPQGTCRCAKARGAAAANRQFRGRERFRGASASGKKD